ncbi:MFS general substrate transporter [Eremomyces bilateralis CBS 781.70]|uniref:MFS general substrate transporter n=1 Tax=Eremomyces bilateralis CBS 781.70 TaxID=1392243 RepID=A0A6G1FY74_9PEZI|nr:MFS general substrate transporter [Eremomyces bilateralis CBS 781.70]KAF1810641.1 MFS general substrate transporter [Eremomyces bilateralis CBS 781.70]
MGDVEKPADITQVVSKETVSSGEQPFIDPAAERRLLWKLDYRIVPILWLLFLLAFLDRSNIGNAKIQGLTKDLNMKGNDYNIALFIFFPPYIIFEVPANLVLRKMAPSTWLSAIMVGWGICTVGQGLVNNLAGLASLRFLIGIFEAGLFPGCIYLISMYYKRYETQWRFSVFFSAGIIAPAFGGLFAYAIAKMEGLGGYSGWRWIFIIEGLITIIIGVASKWLIVDWPEKATFLTEEERRILLARIQADTGDARMDRLDRRSAKRIFTDWKIYCGILMYITVVNTSYSTAFFTPSIIKDMGYTSSAAQIRSIPPWIVAFVVSLGTALVTDRLRHRYSFTIFGLMLCIIGYGILLVPYGSTSVGVKYTALFFVITGCMTAQPIIVAWLSNCASGHYKRAVTSAAVVGFGNCGGLIASNVFFEKEAPAYRTGYRVNTTLICLCLVFCTAMFIGVRWENRKRDRGERDYRLQKEDADNLGDDHPSWRLSH